MADTKEQNGKVEPKSSSPSRTPNGEKTDDFIQKKASQSQFNMDEVKGGQSQVTKNEHLSDEEFAEQPHQHDNDSREEYAELVNMDWEEFEQRYTEDLDRVSHNEDVLRLAFDDYADSIDIWAQTGSLKDDERAHKRLKTRAQFVKLSEKKLEAKQEHYKQVVDAFRSALTLLGGPSSKR